MSTSLARLIMRAEIKAYKRHLIILGVPVHRDDLPLDACTHRRERFVELVAGCFRCSDRYVGKHDLRAVS